ncbi:S-layer homology domain-containing protein [Agathobaculum sp. NTUH-O15-33]|uniref:S-layer homology domain-containing protein n=1 Tax=Agathobaculum sp. NTUH-O15-33 TaxID=3079302 RepID=UPI0029586BC9|nr:S-layer homology domain-containing protein [Agathobaculum sp. NTUH-O15-33]WNX85171.1 S-layer homology domain-containing protein [Agathobaculum sp. NTUH-O15-33]
MKNLKKILALVLAFACAFTMFAGAAFTDSADINVDSEAVDTLVALGVINGYTDGSFQPNGTITRAEAAKMLYVLRTGTDNADAYKSVKSKFTDLNTTKSSWAAGYIKYCESLGIIAGKGANKFDPDNTVTGQELAKMLLVTLGYNADKAKLVGSGWGQRATALADENGLLDSVTAPLTLALPRQYAALMMYNAVDAPTVVWRDDEYTNANILGEDNQTIGEKYMSLKKSTSTLTEVSKTNGKDTYELTLDSNKDVVDWNETTDAEGKAIFSFTDVAKDYSSMKYKTVTVLYKDKKTVYGVFATKDNTENTGILKNLKMDGGKAKLDGTKYDLASTTTVYLNGEQLYKDRNGNFSTTYSTSNDTAVTIKEFINKYGDDASDKYTNAAYFQPTAVSLMATDGTSNYSILSVKTYAVGQVTSVGSDYINVSVKKGDNSISGSTKLEEDDWDWYDGIAKNDYVVLTAAGNYASGNGLVEKATVVTGKVDGTKSDDSVSLDGEWYTMAGKGNAMVKRPNTGSKVDMVVVDGYVYYTDTTAGSVDDIALLVEAAPSGGVNSKWEARMIFADGTDKVVEIEKKWDDKDDGANIIEFHEGNYTNPNISGSATNAEPMLVSYEVSKDVYTLTRLGYPNTDTNDNTIETNGYDEYITVDGGKTDGSIKDGTFSKSISRLYYESTGVVFVKYKAGINGDDGDYKVVTGKTASNYDRNIRKAAAVADQSGNSYYAQCAFLDLGKESTGGGSDNYAVVLEDVVKKTGTADGTVYKITAWNGTEEITITTDDSAAYNLDKGEVISYTGTGDTLADIDTFSSDRQGDYFVASYDSGSGDISMYSLNSDATVQTAAGGSESNRDAWTIVDKSNTTILYVDSDKGEGLTGYDMSDINLAYAFDKDFWSQNKVPASMKYINGVLKDQNDSSNIMSEDFAPNVHAFVDNDGDDQITVLVVDVVNNNITKW